MIPTTITTVEVERAGPETLLGESLAGDRFKRHPLIKLSRLFQPMCRNNAARPRHGVDIEYVCIEWRLASNIILDLIGYLSQALDADSGRNSSWLSSAEEQGS